MVIYTGKNFSIYFGDASQNISKQEIEQQKITKNLQLIADQLNCTQLVFLHQEHGVQGQLIKNSYHRDQFFQQPGDYLITEKTNCGIGVVTADCLPIVIYDSVHHKAGIVHAGWKGLQANILQVAIEKMAHEFRSSPGDLEIYFGPAAGACCYEVSLDFINHFTSYKNYEDAFIEKNSKIYFDSAVFAAIIARNLGIKVKNIYTTYNVCTICDASYCSFRREKEYAHRQITLISLH